MEIWVWTAWEILLSAPSPPPSPPGITIQAGIIVHAEIAIHAEIIIHAEINIHAEITIHAEIIIQAQMFQMQGSAFQIQG